MSAHGGVCLLGQCESVHPGKIPCEWEVRVKMAIISQVSSVNTKHSTGMAEHISIFVTSAKRLMNNFVVRFFYLDAFPVQTWHVECVHKGHDDTSVRLFTWSSGACCLSLMTEKHIVMMLNAFVSHFVARAYPWSSHPHKHSCLVAFSFAMKSVNVLSSTQTCLITLTKACYQSVHGFSVTDAHQKEMLIHPLNFCILIHLNFQVALVYPRLIAKSFKL